MGAGGCTEPVASALKGLETELWLCDSRDDMSALQPAKLKDISANAATCGRRRERSNSTTMTGMVTHSYATNYEFE
jgi:hypothetical protein